MKKILLMFLSFFTLTTLCAQDSKGDILDVLLRKVMETYHPKDSIICMNLNDHFQIQNRPSVIQDKKIVYWDDQNKKQLFAKKDTIEVLSVNTVKLANANVLVEFGIFDGSQKGNTSNLNNAKFYLVVLLKYSCSKNSFEAIGSKKWFGDTKH